MKYNPDKYTLLNWKNLTNSDKRDFPDHQDCVNAILESKDKTAEEPYVIAWVYNQYTYECEYARSFKTLDEAYTRLYFLHTDHICPFKVVAHSKNTACDEENCALFFINKDDDETIIGTESGCAFITIAEVLEKTKQSIECACYTDIGSNDMIIE